MRRRFLSIRCRTGLALMILTFVLYNAYSVFKSVASDESFHKVGQSFPTLDRRKGLRFQAAKRHQQANVIGDSRYSEQQVSGITFNVLNPQIKRQVVDFIKELFPKEWGDARESEEIAIELKSLLLDIGLESNLSCKEIDNLQIWSPRAHSNKLYIDRARFYERVSSEVTIKSQGYDRAIKIKCLEKVYDLDLCTPMGNYKLMRELLYLALFHHPAIVNMLGYCVRGDQISPDLRKKGLIIVTEVGSQLHSGKFDVMPWDRKITLAVQIAELMEFLEKTPIGPIGLGKLDLHDFILVNNGYTLRLVDLDDLTIMDKVCKYETDCNIDGVSLGVRCENGICIGYNKAFNMHTIGKVMLTPMLDDVPSKYSARINKLIEEITSYEISATQAAAAFKLIHQEAILFLNEVNEQRNVYRAHKVENQHPIHNEILPRKVDDQRPSNNENSPEHKHDAYPPGEYDRYDQSNFESIYDFFCENSRVTWGCILSSSSLLESQELCDKNSQCQSFVVYSSSPESDSRLTIILKNSAGKQPQKSAATTLFIRRDGKQVAPRNDKPKNDANTCVRNVAKSYQDAHQSRERRLMTHLGLKGVSESQWLYWVKHQNLSTHFKLLPLATPKQTGGAIILTFDEDEESEETPIIKKVQFMVKKGPDHFHVAHAIVYETDRLLGLYHTPPSTIMSLPEHLNDKFFEMKSFRSAFLFVREGREPLKGVMTVPMPKVMKASNLILKPRKSMVDEVVKFSRAMKMQFEYIFLWWLTKIAKEDDHHIGYKGHMIAFDADRAFQDPLIELTGYFFHCQFPNVVYKTLNCFRCASSQGQGQGSSSVCSLGQEVMRRVKESGFTNPELQIHSYNEHEFAILINDAATVALSLVDQCIRTFNNETVLY